MNSLSVLIMGALVSTVSMPARAATDAGRDVVAAAPVVAAVRVAAPEPVVAPVPVAAPEPVVAPVPVAAPEPVVAPAAVTLPAWVISSTSEISYATFKGSRGYTAVAAPTVFSGGGNQTYLETSYSLSGYQSEVLKLDFLLKSGEVKAEQTTSGFYGSYVGPTDTVASATATYLGIDGVQPYLSLNFNLPTGHPAEFGTGTRARLDPDLVPVPTFGEGFNFGPTIGVNIPVTDSLVFGLSGGITERTPYYREGAFLEGTIFQASSKYTPGMLTSLSGTATYSQGAFLGQVSAAYVSDTTTSIDNIPTSRTGNRFTFGLSTSYALTEQLTATFNGSAVLANPNYTVHPDQISPFSPTGFISSPNGFLTLEDADSNSKVFQGQVGFTYLVMPTFSVSPFVSMLYRDRNSYDPTSNQFIPAKTRLSVGDTAKYQVTDHLTLTGRVEYIRTYQSGSPDKFDPITAASTGNGFIPGSDTVSLNYRGWQLAAGVAYSF